MQEASLDRYELGPVLGISALQRTVAARDRELDRPVVVKIALQERDGPARRLHGWDSRWLSRLEHPHLMPILAIGQQDGLPFHVEPRAERTFAAFRTEPASWEELKGWLLQALDGLSYLHARGILHGALKPEDLALMADGEGQERLCITDAGRMERREAGDRYAPPELQRRDLAQAGPWSDLWSLGALLWELLTGELPGGPDRRFVPRLPVPSRMEVLLTNLLEEHPLGRYDLAADVRVEIEALANGEGEASGGTVARGHAVDTTLDDVVLDVAEAARPETEADHPLLRIRWNRPAARPMPEQLPSLSSPGELVGREEILRSLWREARAVATSRQPRVVVLLGEAGSGRSALLRAFTCLLEEQGHAETVWLDHGPVPTEEDGVAGAVRAWIRPGPVSLEVVEQRLQARLHREGADASVAKVDAQSLARWLGASPAGQPPVPAVHAPRELSRVLKIRAWRGLSCLVLDDARWAAGDSDSLLLVDALLLRRQDNERNGQRDDLPLLVLVVLESSALEEDASLRARLNRWEEAGILQLELPGLDPEAMAALASKLGLPEEARANCLAEAAGSPLRLALLAELGPEERALPGEQGWRDLLSLTARVLEALSSRSGQPRRMADLAQLLALAGRAVPASLVRHFSGGELDQFVARTGWYRPRGDRLVATSDSLHRALRELAQQRSDKAYLHRRLGRAFGKLAAEPGEGGALLEAARHALAASEHAYGVPLALAAAERAWHSGRAHALELASQMALEAVDDPRTGMFPHKAAASLWRGRALLAARSYVSAGHRFDEARAAFEAEGNGKLAVEAQLGAGHAALGRGEVEAADRIFSAAAARAHELAALALEAQALAGKAQVEVRRRRWEDADVLFARSLARHSQLSDLHGAALAVLGQGLAARQAGRFDEADGLYAEAVEHFREAGDPSREIEAQLGLALSRRQRLSDEVCEILFSAAADRAAELGEAALLGVARVGLADLARERKDFERAQRIYTDCTALGGEVGVNAWLGLAQCALDQGDLTAAYEHGRTAAQGLEALAGHPAWARYRIVVAALLALRRDHTQTWQWLWSAQEVGLAEITDRDHAACLRLLCEVAAEARWGNVLRLAGKLGVEQLERLQDEAGAAALRERVAAALA